MANITGYGRPTIYTVGNKGDIYTDTNTGIQYECLGPDGFVDISGSEENNKYDWKEIQTAGGGISVPCSWDNLIGRPFGTNYDLRPLFENRTVNIEHVVLENEAVENSGWIDGFDGFDTYGELLEHVGIYEPPGLAEGPYKCIVRVDGVNYNTYFITSSTEMYSNTVELVNGGHFLISRDDNRDATPGFKIEMSESNIGTHEFSMYVDFTEIVQIDDKYIPDTVQRVNDSELILKNIELYGAVKIPAGETVASPTPGGNVIADRERIGRVVCIAVGEYFTDEEKVNAVSIPLNCTLNKTYYDMGDYIMCHISPTITIPEPIEYDITVSLYYDAIGSMGVM